jgi:hypothetical protein
MQPTVHEFQPALIAFVKFFIERVNRDVNGIMRAARTQLDGDNRPVPTYAC